VRTRLRIGAACCGLMMTVVGCGGGRDRLSASGYARAASTTCVHANRMVARVELPTLSNRQDASRAIARVVTVSRHTIDELRDLRPPGPLAETVEQWIALLDQAADELESMAAQLRAAQVDAALDFGTKATTLFDRAEQLATRLRVTSCRGPELPIAGPLASEG
jgi:hypothetical protein